MSDATDSLAWATVTPRRCRRHEWAYLPTGMLAGPAAIRCTRCGQPKDEAVSRRAKIIVQVKSGKSFPERI